MPQNNADWLDEHLKRRIAMFLEAGIDGEPPALYNKTALRLCFAEIGVTARALRFAIKYMLDSGELVSMRAPPWLSGPTGSRFLCPEHLLHDIDDKIRDKSNKQQCSQEEAKKQLATIKRKQQEYGKAKRERLQARGLRQSQFWVTAEERAMLRGVLKQHREGKQ